VTLSLPAANEKLSYLGLSRLPDAVEIRKRNF